MTEVLHYAIVADNVSFAPIGLARRTEAGDEAYHRDHGWRPTKVITRSFETDADDDVVPITAAEADALRKWFHHRQGDPPLIGGSAAGGMVGHLHRRPSTRHGPRGTRPRPPRSRAPQRQRQPGGARAVPPVAGHVGR